MKMALVSVLAVIAFLGSLAVADAQSGVQNEAPPGVQNGAKMSETGPKFVIGWNYVHATNCYGYFDGSTTWLYVFPVEGGFWFTSNATFQRTIAPACQTGNFIGFNVFNSSGDWDLVVTFTFR